MVDYIDQHREEHGVEPICEVLQFAPSTYHAAKSRPTSARAVRDAVTKVALASGDHPFDGRGLSNEDLPGGGFAGGSLEAVGDGFPPRGAGAGQF